MKISTPLEGVETRCSSRWDFKTKLDLKGREFKQEIEIQIKETREKGVKRKLVFKMGIKRNPFLRKLAKQ